MEVGQIKSVFHQRPAGFKIGLDLVQNISSTPLKVILLII